MVRKRVLVLLALDVLAFPLSQKGGCVTMLKTKKEITQQMYPQ
jgi:hypothetical protein